MIGEGFEPRRKEEREEIFYEREGIPFATFEQLRGLRPFAVKKGD